MKTLPNGVRVFNGTPHVIRFWREDWEDVVEVEPDETISARIVEAVVEDGAQLRGLNTARRNRGVTFVNTQFLGTEKGTSIIRQAYISGADIVVGSIIAAQAYPDVVAMIPAPGYERVPPAEKRMNPDKFTVF